MRVRGFVKFGLLPALVVLVSFFSVKAQTKFYRIAEEVYVETDVSALPVYNILEETSDNFSFDYHFDVFSVNDIQGEDGNPYQLVRIGGFNLNNNAGKPALPVKTEKIVIPPGKRALVSSRADTFVEYHDIDIYPAQDLGSDGVFSPVGFSKDEKAYQTDSFYPAEMAELTNEQTFRGLTMGYIRIRPVQYNPVTRVLRIFKDLKIDISFVDDESASPDKSRIQKNADYSILSNSVINKNSIPEPADKTAYYSEPKGYLIITVPQFEAAAQSLGRWKSQLGYHVVIESRSSWTVSQVKTFVTNTYNYSGYDFDYLLFIGDQDHVPDYYYEDVMNDDPWEIHSMNYYACMDGIYDYVPEMAHGRISVRDAGQAMTVVNKIINYEKTPPSDPNFYKKGLHAGYFQDSTGDGYSDYRYARTTIEMYDYMTQQQNFQSDLVLYAEPTTNPLYFHPYFSGLINVPPQYLRSNGYPWDGDKNDIIGALNDGRLYAFHRDHGKANRWMAPYFDTDDMDQLTNAGELPVVLSVNCGTGKFTYDEPFECFAEKLQRMPNGGAVGVVAATAETISGFNDGLIIGMMDAIWAYPGIIPDMGAGADTVVPHPHGPIYAMGDVMIQGLIRMTETWDPYGWADKNQFHLYHYFGDPAMQIWTAQPVQLSVNHPDELIPGTTSIYLSGINADAVDATLCIGDELLRKVRIYGGSGTMQLPRAIDISDEDIVLTLSKHNYIPYISELQVSLPPEPLFGADLNEICAEESIQFTDASLYNPDTWLWEVQPAGYEFVHSNANSQNPRIRFNLPGYYTVSLTVSNDFGSATLTKQDYVLAKAIPDAPYAEDESRCYDAEIPTLSASGSNIRWFGGADLTDLLHEGPEYTPPEAPVGETDFYITQTVSDCESDAGVVTLLTYPETAVPEVTGSAICEYDTAYFIAQGTYLKWYTDSTGSELTALGDTLIRYPLPEGENTFFVSNTENECESGLVPCAILVKPKPDKPLAVDTEVCQGEEVILVGEGEHIYWYDNAGLQDPLYFGNSFKADINEPGEYTYYLTQEVGSCISDPEQVSAFIHSLPLVNLGNDTTIYYSDSISLGTTLEGQYLWNNGSTENSQVFVGSVYGLGNHTLWLEVISPDNCQASDTLVVAVVRSPREVSYYHFMGNIFNVYPNPVSDNLNIRFFQSIELPTRIILRDTMGNLALLEEFNEIEHGSFIELNISGISGGLYLLTIENENIVHTLPILVK